MKLLQIIFSIFFSLVFIIEAWGLPNGRELSLYLIIGGSIVFAIMQVLISDELIIPPFIMIAFTLFLMFVTVSSFFSVDFHQALRYNFYYVALILFFLYCYNSKSLLIPIIPGLLAGLSVVTTVYAGIFQFFLAPQYPFLIPPHGYQLIYPYVSFLNHHPLGVVALLALPYFLVKLLRKFTLSMGAFSVIFLGILLFSYLRTAYVAFIAGCIIYILKVKNIRLKDVIALSLSMVLLIIFLFGASSIGSNETMIRKYFGKRVEFVNLYDKPLWNGRNIYFSQAINGISQRPWIGVGSGNFPEISKVFAKDDYEFVETSLNIELDIAAENGIIAAVIFIICIVVIGLNVVTKNTVLSEERLILIILFGALFVLFQFHYYHRVHVVFFIFMVISGLIYNEEKNIVIHLQKRFEYKR